MKPSTIFSMFIQEPDFGACFSHAGNRAKSVKGRAKASAKPNMPRAGASQLPLVVVSTSSSPMMGAVHENETSTKVNAIRKMESSPLVVEALVSTAFAQLSGNLISNQPKNDRAKTTSSTNRKMLNTALVDMAFSVSLPNSAVTSSPKPR